MKLWDLFHHSFVKYGWSRHAGQRTLLSSWKWWKWRWLFFFQRIMYFNERVVCLHFFDTNWTMTESFNQRNYWFQILHYLYLSMHDGDIDCNQQLLSEDEMSDEADPEKLIQWFWGFRLWFSANQECLIPFIKSLWFKILLNFFHTLLKGFFGLSQERNSWSRHSCTNSLLTWLWNKVFFWDFAHQFLFQKR